MPAVGDMFVAVVFFFVFDVLLVSFVEELSR